MLLASVVLMGVGCSPSLAKVEEPLRADLAKGVLHVGEVSFGQRVSRVFGFTNVSGVPVRIERVRADCTCHEIEHFDGWIEPGQHSTLSVDVEVRGRARQFRSVFHVFGQRKGSATELLATFTLVAELEHVYRLYTEPQFLVLPPASPDHELQFSVVLEGSRDPGALTALHLRTTHRALNGFEFSDGLVVEGPSGPRVHTTLRGTLDEGTRRDLEPWDGLLITLPARDGTPALSTRLGLRSREGDSEDGRYVYVGLRSRGSRAEIQVELHREAGSPRIGSRLPWVWIERVASGEGGMSLLCIADDAPLGPFETELVHGEDAVDAPRVLLAGVVR